MQIRSAKELVVHQKAFELALQVFRISRLFPPEEKYSLTDQIRRSSRSVCNYLREAWAKRRYQPHFISKLTDCDGENSETETSLDFALACGYVTQEQHAAMVEVSHEIGRMLGSMIRNPRKFAPPAEL